MDDQTYLVATIRSWNITVFEEIISKYPGNWHLVTNPVDLTVALVQKMKPRYIFFPHWSNIVSPEIMNLAECVCFHETDLPYGRGGSPIQNLIARGHTETMISAIRMTEHLDAGPIYFKEPLSLAGLAEEIYVKASKIIAKMILIIVTNEPSPKEQKGISNVFERRKPYQSEIPKDSKTLQELFDHIRMLDAKEYPQAFIEYGAFKIEFIRPALRTDSIEVDAKITYKPKKIND